MTRAPDEDLRGGDSPFDVLLRERLEGTAPPDLRARVQELLARGEGAAAAGRLARAEAGAPSAGPRLLLSAAVVLLGLGVVVATCWLVRPRTAGDDSGSAADLRAASGPQPVPPATAPGESGRQGPEAQDPQGRPVIGDLGFELRVVDHHGGPVQTFELTVLKVLSRKPLTAAKILGHPPRALHPRDFPGDFARIGRLPAGDYLVTIRADAYAMTVSDPFAIVAGEPSPKVTVELDLGGEIRGVVLDDAGKPVAGALVRTEGNVPAELSRNPKFAEMLGKMWAMLHTEAKARTDASGAFRLGGLTLGSYALRVRHPDHCETTTRDLEVTAEPIEELEVRLERGAVVHGRILDTAGRPVADVEVRVSPSGPDTPRTAGWTTVSDAQGRFRFPLRLPFGRYEIQGSQRDLENPFDRLLQIRDSRRAIVIDRGSPDVEQDLELSRR